MTQEQLATLRAGCTSFLKANKLRPGTKTGDKAIHTFWLGALVALNDTQNPYVTICLLSGRHADLTNQGE